MSEQDNLRIIRQGWDAWNAHDVEAALKVLDEKHVWETDTLPAPVVGRDGYRQAMQMYLAAFPDLRFSIDQLLSSERRLCGDPVHGDGNPSGRLDGYRANKPAG